MIFHSENSRWPFIKTLFRLFKASSRHSRVRRHRKRSNEQKNLQNFEVQAAFLRNFEVGERWQIVLNWLQSICSLIMESVGRIQNNWRRRCSNSSTSLRALEYLEILVVLLQFTRSLDLELKRSKCSRLCTWNYTVHSIWRGLHSFYWKVFRDNCLTNVCKSHRQFAHLGVIWSLQSGT